MSGRTEWNGKALFGVRADLRGKEAGAHKPACPISAGAPRRPDPHPGRRRARLSLLLPALGLLLGALCLFPATPADAQMLLVYANNQNVTEGDEIVFNVRLTTPSDQTVTVQYATESGAERIHGVPSNANARSGSDFTAASGTLSFAPGETRKTVRVSTTSDSAYEFNETFYLRLTNPTNARLSVSRTYRRATGTIVDDDPPPTVSISDGSATEGDEVEFKVSLSAPTGRPVSVDVKPEVGPSDTATLLDDFDDRSGQLGFLGGTEQEPPSFTVRVTTVDDDIGEEDETFSVRLSNPRGLILGDATATGTIIDDDGTPSPRGKLPTVGFMTDPHGDEGNWIRFWVRLSKPSDRQVSVQYRTSSGTAQSGTDFTSEAGLLVFQPGETFQDVYVGTTRLGGSDEGNETFTMTLSNPTNATLSDATATGTITELDTDVDGSPFVAVKASTDAVEGNPVTFTVRLSAPSEQTVTVQYQAQGIHCLGDDCGSATSGVDYAATSGTLTFAPRETEKTVSVSTTDDSDHERTERLDLELSNPTNAVFRNGWSNRDEEYVTARILDNDDPPVASFALQASSVQEDSGTHNVTVNLSPTPTYSITLNYRVESGTAARLEDHGLGSGAVSVPSGATTATLPVQIIDDDVEDSGETFVLALTAGAGYRVGANSKHTVTILNHETAATPEVSISAGTGVTEGGSATFTLRASPAPAAALTVDVTVTESGGYATAGTRQVTVPRGGTATFTVATVDDGADEPDGSVTATLAAGTGYTVSSSRGTATVAVADNDDAAPANPYAALIAQMYEWRNDPQWAYQKAHTDRWDRALLAFGEAVSDASLTTMTAAEAQAFADRGWTRWVEVAAALQQIENSVAQPPAPEPELDITAVAVAVDEGGNASFTITANPAPAAPLAVALTVSQSGDHVASGATGSRTVSVPRGGTATFTVATVDDGADEPDGSVTATLAAGTGYTVSSSRGTATVAVADNDDAAPANPYAALIANIQGWRDDPCCVSDKAHTDRWDRVLKAFGQPVSDGSLTAMSAVEAQTYADRGWTRWVAVAEALHEIEGGGPPAVQEPAPVPVVTIAAGDPVTEGADAGFTLTATPAPAADLAVDVSVSQSGAFADASALGARTVTIPAGTASAAFTVATVDDTADEADGAVTAAVTGGAGYTPGSAASATVAVADDDEALPAILTKRSIAREGTDGAAVFTVGLSRAAAHPVSVDWATADAAGSWAGTAPARAGADYSAASGTLTFAPGQTFGTVSVPILDDSIDEGTEYFLLRFSNPDGATLAAGKREVQGLIRNSDPLQAMWLARFGRMVASDAVASVTARLETPRDAGSHVTVAGQRMNFGEAEGTAALATVLTGFAQTFGAPSAPARDGDDPFARHRLTSGWNDPATVTGARRVTGRELLLGTSFRAVLGQGAGSQWTSWGQGASVSRFSAAVPGLGLSGEAATGSMGMDYERGRLLMGFAMTHSVGEGTASDAGWRYALGSTATMAMPYARLALTDRISAWGLAGTGSGTLSLDLDGAVPQSYRTDLAMTLAATGVRGDLVTPAEPGGFALALKADAFWVRTESDRVTAAEFGSLMGARGESSRVRAVLDGSRTFSFASGAALTPKLELGVRHDAGDAETGTGMEFGAGLGYADPSRGLDMALKVHGLAVHAEDGYEEWGVSGQLRLVPGGAGRGLSMSLTPSWGADPAGSQRLWALPASSGLAANPGSGSGAGGAAEPSSRFDAEVGYGMALLGDRFTGTPNVGFGLSDTARDLRIGWRLTSAVRGDPGFEVSLDATRREAANDNDAEHGVMLRSLIRW